MAFLGGLYDRFLVNSAVTREMEGMHEPSSDMVEKVASMVDKLNRSATKNGSEIEMDIPISLCGRVINAAVWDKENWEFVKQNVEIGSFVMLRNVEITNFPIHKLPSKFFCSVFV